MSGHNQNTQNAHLAQLALYTLLLQISLGVESNEGRTTNELASPEAVPGASSGAMLLYLNQKSARAIYVSPMLTELKSLIGQRNVAAAGVHKSSRPRGIALSYEDEDVDGKGKSKQ